MDGYLPWYIGGPIFGLCVAGLYALANERLGVSGSYLHIGKLVRRREGRIERRGMAQGREHDRVGDLDDLHELAECEIDVPSDPSDSALAGERVEADDMVAAAQVH